MSFITTDYSNLDSKEYGALPTGEYEVIIASAKETATPNGAESLQLDLIVRNDLVNVPTLAATNGKFSNRHIFMDNWKRKATQQYDTDGFMYILQAVGVPEGTPVNSVNDFIKLITWRPVRVYVKKETDSYKTTDPNNPEYKNAVAPWNFSSTKFKEVNHTGQERQPQSNTQKFEVSDSDFPF